MNCEISINGVMKLVLAFSISSCLGVLAGLGGVLWATSFLFLIFIIGISFVNKCLFFKIFWLWILFPGIIINTLGMYQNVGVQYLDEFMLGILLFQLLINLKNLKTSDRKVLTAICLLIFIAILSTIVNSSPIGAFISFLSAYLRILIFTVCARSLLSKSEIKEIIATIFYTGVAQFIIASIQFFTFGRINLFVGREITIIQDAACGTFGYYGAHQLGHLMVILFVLSSSLALYSKRKVYLSFAFIFLMTFFLTFTELDYLFLFGYLFMLFCQKGFKFRYKLPITVILIISAALFFTYQRSSQGRFYQLITNERKIVNSGKVQSLFIMKDLISRDIVNFTVGIGPGTFCSSSAFKHKGDFFRKYVEDRRGEVHSTLDYRWSSFMAIIVETGLFSFFLYVLLFAYFLRKSILIMRWGSGNLYDKGIAFAYISILIFFAYSTLILNSFEIMGLTFPIAMVSAYVLKVSQDLEAHRG